MLGHIRHPFHKSQLPMAASWFKDKHSLCLMFKLLIRAVRACFLSSCPNQCQGIIGEALKRSRTATPVALLGKSTVGAAAICSGGNLLINWCPGLSACPSASVRVLCTSQAILGVAERVVSKLLQIVDHLSRSVSPLDPSWRLRGQSNNIHNLMR